MIQEVTKEMIDAFFKAEKSQERIIKIETDYDSDKVVVIYRDEKGQKRMCKKPFYPFLWCRAECAACLFGGDREKLKNEMSRRGIGCKGLRTSAGNGVNPERVQNGYRIMFYAKTQMSYSSFLKFFDDGGRPVFAKVGDANYGKDEYVVVGPVEQYMISTGDRMFKGIENYNDLVRMEWDLETEGLDPTINAISQIGIRTNKGFEKIITIEGEGEEKRKNEIQAIDEFLHIIAEIKPDVITGHNTENFDWNFIDVRLQLAGTTLLEFSKDLFFNKGVYKQKKQKVLKLGGEVEYYYPTVMWGYNITDSLFAVRRAQALDSNMKKADLKYVTKYARLAKPNRVYVPGKQINTVWLDKEKNYGFNEENGRWFKIEDELFNRTFDNYGVTELRFTKTNDGKILDRKENITYEYTTGRYIVQRYLLDDLWESDKVEDRYNETNFLIAKLVPISFEKSCTTGTAALWKFIMLAWSYENNLAIPNLTSSRRFTGGLSRLLSVGFVNNVLKADFNSLYPSIILTFNIKSEVDVMDTMTSMLEYVLTEREKSKGLKKKWTKEAEKLKEKLQNLDENSEEYQKTMEELDIAESNKNRYDKDQLQKKVLGNSFFGAYGSGSSSGFYWSDVDSAEETTCTGRQMLRLMIKYFKDLSYEPIVGDTDGFNFKITDHFRYTEENPYISPGLGRNTVEGKAYIKEEADVAYFEDTYMHSAFNGGINKNGLDIDEYCDATINFARKNYADLMPNGKKKLVGNTIKSKKMPIYIEKFLDTAIDLLLHGKGKEFLEFYYDYIEKIYNMQIPLKDIASVGKIKTSIDSYKAACKELTAGGTKKSRQAWYELAIKDGLSVNMGDAIYYINVGKKKGDSDVKRVTKYYTLNANGEKNYFSTDEKTGEMLLDRRGNPIPLVKTVDKKYKEYTDEEKKKNTPKKDIKNKIEFVKTLTPQTYEEDEIIFNCVRLSNDIVEDEDDHFCDDNFEYNTEKYIEMFNKRIRPLLVCFDKSIRTVVNDKGKEIDNILISNPKDRKCFTEDESRLVSGQPYNITDQDTYEQLMTMEDKEIRFWLSVDKEPPYTKECGIDWEQVKTDYLQRMEMLKTEEIQKEIAEYNKIIDEMTQSEVETVYEEGILPDRLLKIVTENQDTREFISKKYGVVIGSIFDVIDKDFSIEKNGED